MIREKDVRKAIDQVLKCMDRKGYWEISSESRTAYDTLHSLREELEGDINDGSALVFYYP
jgi:hypothetical protein